MAVSRVFSVLMVALLLGSAVAQSPFASPSPAPSIPKPRRGAPARSPLSEPPSYSPLASPAPTPANSLTPPPSPSPAGAFSPPLPPPSESSTSPSVALPPSSDFAPVPSPNGAVLNRLGFAAAAAGFFAVALVA